MTRTRRPIISPGLPLQAKADDPIEYDGFRRRPFWIVMAERASVGDRNARHCMALRAAAMDSAP